MSNADTAVLRAIEVKLQNLLRCMLNKAAADPTFARELEEVLLTDSLAKKLRAPKVKTPRPPVFQPVPYLHENGEEKLRDTLKQMTDENLRAVARREKVLHGKEPKSLDREKLVSGIIQHAQQRLQQGSVFLR